MDKLTHLVHALRSNAQALYPGALARSLSISPPPSVGRARMSCHVPPITMISMRALPLVLTLVGVPSVATAQTSVCHAIRAGETATQLARRLTGDGRNKYQPWFQIVDASSRSVPKSQYDRIRRGWRVCIAQRETIQRAILPVSDDGPSTAATVPVRTAADGPAVSPQATVAATVADFLSPLAGDELRWVWIGAAVVLPLFGWRIVDNYAARRKTRLIVMQHFAKRFVSEFERPLMQQP